MPRKACKCICPETDKTLAQRQWSVTKMLSGTASLCSAVSSCVVYCGACSAWWISDQPYVADLLRMGKVADDSVRQDGIAGREHFAPPTDTPVS